MTTSIATVALRIAFISLLAAGTLVTAGAVFAATTLHTVRVAQGLARPLFVASPPGDTSRVFIVEQRGSDNRGRVKILKNGTILAKPFLTTGVLSTGSEQGLLGFAFAPDYATSGRFYINYTRTDGTTIIERRQVSANPDTAQATGVTILTVPQPFANHNGGWLGFGPDGYLYIGMGDGGDAGDPGDRAQNLNVLYGKILRLDVSGATYTSPPTNPFAGATTGLDEIWAFGLRNPWRPSFDRVTGDLIIADVGQANMEEIDFQHASSAGGENYGWRCYEGSTTFASSTTTPCGMCVATACPKVFPAYEYTHGSGTCSITGGYVYRGCAIPDLQGQYFFADYCAGKIWSGTFSGGTLQNVVDRTAELAPGGGLTITNITSFGEDARGEIYICEQDGEVYKIVPQNAVSGCTLTGAEVTPPSPQARRLGASPVPFRADLKVALNLPTAEHATIHVYDARGRLVRRLLDESLAAGPHHLRWDGRDASGGRAAAGIYFIRYTGAGHVESRRVVLLK